MRNGENAGTAAGVSFVVPVYNKASALPPVLDAIAAQTGDFEREFIFIDDGSTDGSLDLIRDRTSGWQDVVIRAQANHGSAHATNQGIALAGREYIKFVDADDLLPRNATRILLDAIAGTDACLAYGDLVRYSEGATVSLDRSTPAAPDVTTLYLPLRAVLRTSLFNPSQILVRGHCAKQVGGCDERVVFSQEYSLALRLARLWPFRRVNAVVAYQSEPAGEADRLSGDPGQQLQRVTLAAAHFLRDYPTVPPALQRFALRRAAGRAYKWRRRSGTGALLPWLWLSLRGRLPVPTDYVGAIERCAAAFDAP
ncbi:MAG: glycosyltransferase [Alphaproteobacteria bacterium]|jgi:hypothetical protein|nr:glycosyltransferase [Alphaproteobacteria bacterium]MDP6516032.1 glycosyltransferase [Alphaproteobacteria bacterium]